MYNSLTRLGSPVTVSCVALTPLPTPRLGDLPHPVEYDPSPLLIGRVGREMSGGGACQLVLMGDVSPFSSASASPFLLRENRLTMAIPGAMVTNPLL